MSDSDDGPERGRWPGTERRGHAARRQAADRRAARAPAARAAQESRGDQAERRRAPRRSGAERRHESGWEDIPLGQAGGGDPADEGTLIAAAAEARTRAHARYSGFRVGAALETADGVLVTGCNIENATYGLTLCAERVALVKALSDGHVIFRRIAVVADTPSPTPPCGACRQLLWEYCGDVEVLLANLEGTVARHRLAALLPQPFDGRLLE